MILIPFTCSIWHAEHLESDTGFVLPEEPMAQIDAKLCGRFQLPTSN